MFDRHSYARPAPCVSLGAAVRALVLSSVLGIVAFGCDRPFREVEPPSIRIVEPDVSEVQLSSSVVVTVSTESFRTVDRLEVDFEPARFDSSIGLWVDTLALDPGLNSFVFRAFDADGAVRTDTIRFVRVVLSDVARSETLPQPLGGHATTLLQNGRVLLTGGAASTTGAGRRDAYLMFPPFSVQRLVNEMQVGRVGHSATLLPDGRVLIAGGSRSANIAQLSDLVEPPEIYDPASSSFTSIPVAGEPIQRAYHSAAVYETDEGVVLDLYGGLGDVSFGSGGSLGTRRDVRSFLLRGDTLHAQGSAIGGILLDPLAGHTQTSLSDASSRSEEETLILGARFAGGDFETVALVLDYTRSPNSLHVSDLGPVHTPRTQHAAVRLRTPSVLILGGRQGSSGMLVRRTELYIHETKRFFSFPDGVLEYNVFGHSATKLVDGRILVTGGFGANSDASAVISVFEARI